MSISALVKTSCRTGLSRESHPKLDQLVTLGRERNETFPFYPQQRVGRSVPEAFVPDQAIPEAFLSLCRELEGSHGVVTTTPDLEGSYGSAKTGFVIAVAAGVYPWYFASCPPGDRCGYALVDELIHFWISSPTAIRFREFEQFPFRTCQDNSDPHLALQPTS
jgi:hypothetical protein